MYSVEEMGDAGCMIQYDSGGSELNEERWNFSNADVGSVCVIGINGRNQTCRFSLVATYSLGLRN